MESPSHAAGAGSLAGQISRTTFLRARGQSGLRPHGANDAIAFPPRIDADGVALVQH